MNTEIIKQHQLLKTHPLYTEIRTIEDLRIFMSYHVFAVWDFMSLLKSLQTKITCTSLPWYDSKFDPKLVRLINEIVLGEESDLDFNGEPSSHFSLYLKAMKEVGADTSYIDKFLSTKSIDNIPVEISDIINFHLDTAFNSKVHEIASSFFYGREKLIPDMFQAIVNILEDNKIECPTLIYYFKRHIELDGDEHGPMAMKCLNFLLDTEDKKIEADNKAIESLKYRYKLWDQIRIKIIEQNKSIPIDDIN